MRILAIDYGKRKIGLALATSSIAEPYKVVRYKSEKEVLEKIEEIVKAEKIEKIVIGISEGKMAEETKSFAKKLNIPVVFQDETLTTQQAQELSIKAGIKRKKRKSLEDAYSATLILQAYLDSKNTL